MLKTGSIPGAGKRRAVAAGRHVTERLAAYKREVARLSEETRGQQRLLEALLLPRVQLQHAGPFKLPSHLLHCSNSSSVGVSVDPEGPGLKPGLGELNKCTQTKVKEEMEDHEIRDHNDDDEAGDPWAAGEPSEKAASEATDSDLQIWHLEEIQDDLSSGIETEDSEDGDTSYRQEPCKLTPQTQGEKSKKAQEGGGGVVVAVGNGGRETVSQSDWRPTPQRCRSTPWSCKVCPASFPNAKLFLWHIREHKQECAWCGLRRTRSAASFLSASWSCTACEDRRGHTGALLVLHRLRGPARPHGGAAGPAPPARTGAATRGRCCCCTACEDRRGHTGALLLLHRLLGPAWPHGGAAAAPPARTGVATRRTRSAASFLSASWSCTACEDRRGHTGALLVLHRLRGPARPHGGAAGPAPPARTGAATRERCCCCTACEDRRGHTGALLLLHRLLGPAWPHGGAAAAPPATGVAPVWPRRSSQAVQDQQRPRVAAPVLAGGAGPGCGKEGSSRASAWEGRGEAVLVPGPLSEDERERFWEEL
ncbi:hypothetical protein CRUP_004333 [Coryphaenoides rupestris]|nr:hypothetical protein CRUP_004333 [Coryphaenoides rupestris]